MTLERIERVENYPITYTGSVKNVREIKPPSAATGMGIALFEYTDDYSVFDYGKMPETIAGKGISMALVAAYLLERIHADIGRTHYIGIADANGNIVRRLDDLQGEPSGVLAVKSVRVIRPQEHTVDGKVSYDYLSFSHVTTNYLVPLEHIFRFGVPKGSSLLKRTSNPEYLKEIGLDAVPKEGKWLPHPVIEHSTKLEETGDRFLDAETAGLYSGLSPEQFQQMRRLTLHTAQYLRQFFGSIGLETWDGKFEYAVDADGQLMLVDAIGMDELRLLKNGTQLSKEALRQWHKTHDKSWYEQFMQRKEAIGAKKAREEMERAGILPGPVDTDLMRTLSFMYQAFANAVTGRERFKNVPSLDDVVAGLKKAA